jgi:hypothetical protein
VVAKTILSSPELGNTISKTLRGGWHPDVFHRPVGKRTFTHLMNVRYFASLKKLPTWKARQTRLWPAKVPMPFFTPNERLVCSEKHLLMTDY